VMGIGMLLRRADGLGHAAHVGLAGPVEGGERALRFEIIRFRIGRHAQPVEAAHIFAPADDLADEALDGVQGRIRRHRRIADLARLKQTAIEIRRNHGMIEKILRHLHGVLVIAEILQAILDEMRERLQRIRARHRPAEGFEIAEVIGEAPAHETQHLARDGIGRKPQAFGRNHALGQLAAVLGIVVPLAALGLGALHEEAGAAAHLAVEELHAVLLLRPRPAREFTPCTDEARILADEDGKTQRLAPALHHPLHAPLARLGGDHLRGLMPRDRPLQLAREGARVRGIIERDVIDGDAPAPQLFRKVPHGAEEESDLLLVMAHVGGLVPDLGHEHAVVRGEPIERGDAARELIAEDEAERRHARALPRAAARHLSEQYFTSAQTFAHFLRHAKGFPHWAQVLAGREDFFFIFGMGGASRKVPGHGSMRRVNDMEMGDRQRDIDAIKALIARQFESLSWRAEKEADWAGFAADFVDGAPLYAAARPVAAQTVYAFVTRMKRLAASTLPSLQERVVASEVTVSGNVAVAMAVCEMVENGAEVNRNVEMLLLVKDEGRWRIAAQAWDRAGVGRELSEELVASSIKQS
jgi:hypothetical protein